jgi:benzoyl-CoA 2,3-dioxygenase component A
LPPQAELPQGTGASVEALDEEVDALIAAAHSGHGGSPVPPASAGKPTINLYNRARPIRATVVGNYRLTDAGTDNDIHHIILDFGGVPFPVLEGQSVGILVPGVDDDGVAHKVRLYSIASPRDGEKPNSNNVAFTVKRVPGGLCSNYFCGLTRGATVDVTGPFGATFLMPNDPGANLIMICTGTGSAPFRAFIKQRLRAMPQAAGALTLFFGARRPEELPYFGPLKKLPDNLITRHICFSRLAETPKTYVQDAIRREADSVGRLLKDDVTHVFLCGLKAMEAGVDEALKHVCDQGGLDWPSLKAAMRSSGRYQVETY